MALAAAAVDIEREPASGEEPVFEFTIAEDLDIAVEVVEKVLRTLEAELAFTVAIQNSLSFEISIGGNDLFFVGLNIDQLAELRRKLGVLQAALEREKRPGRATATELAALYVDLQPNHVELYAVDSVRAEEFAENWDGRMAVLLRRHPDFFSYYAGIHVAVRRRDRQEAEQDLEWLLEQDSSEGRKWGSRPLD